MKKIFIFISLLILITLFLSGCSKKIEKENIEIEIDSRITFSNNIISFKYPPNSIIYKNRFNQIGFLKIINNESIYSLQIVSKEKYQTIDSLRDKIKAQINVIYNIELNDKNKLRANFSYKNKIYEQNYKILDKNNYYFISSITSPKNNKKYLKDYNELLKSISIYMNNFSFIELPLAVPIIIDNINRSKKIEESINLFLDNYNINDKLIIRSKNYLTVFTKIDNNKLKNLNNKIFKKNQIVNRIISDVPISENIKIMGIMS